MKDHNHLTVLFNLKMLVPPSDIPFIPENQDSSLDRGSILTLVSLRP